MQRFNELQQERRVLEARMRELAKGAFSEAAAELFASHPNLLGFGWRQYTPYFNDGDACTFSAHTDYPTVWYRDADGNEVESDENARWTIQWRAKQGQANPVLDPLALAVIEFLERFGDDTYEDLFGDHCEVRVRPTGTTVEPYDHD
jgi:hypothetical protein